MALIILWIPLILVIQVLIVAQSVLQGIVSLSPKINLVVGVLLAVNLFLMALLLLFWFLERKRGRLDRAYLDRCSGLQKLGLLAAKYLLLPAAAWEGLMALLCARFMLIQPRKYLPPLR